VRVLWDLVDPELEPFAPDQPIIFVNGPLTGTPAPASGRSVAVFRSPATGTVGAANCGGYFGRELKRAGWDGLIITGRAEAPVYLSVTEQGVEVRDATAHWGKGINDTEASIKEELGDPKVQLASIGPAGEKLVLFAAIINDKHRAWGRGGPGALMGSKNLKAVAVRGSREMPVADPAALKELGKAAQQESLAEGFVGGLLSKHGTPTFYDAISSLGILPTKNWMRGTYPESYPELGHEAYHEKLEVKSYACSGCPIACGRLSTIKDGKWAGMEGGGPEYEAVAAFGSKPLVSDLNAVAAANFIATDLGMDIISCGQAITTAIEWYESGVLTDADTGGMPLKWGDGEAVVELAGMIGRREGVGDLLAEGVKRAAEKLGPQAEAAAMHVKGMEMAADGVHASHSMSIVHATSARGADHLRPYSSAIDALGYRSEELGIADPISPLEDGNKAWVKPLQALSMTTNMMGVCLFTVITLSVQPSTWAGLLTAALGREVTKDELLELGERVINLERLLNARFGFDRTQDTLPARFVESTVEDGQGHGSVVGLDEVLDSYYGAMGWDVATGLPTEATVNRLGLDWTGATAEAR